MKKFLIPIVAFVLLFSLVSVLSANPCYVTDLIADGGGGSGIDVGDVSVWNDSTNVYVKYKITDPDWCIIETHLEVKESVGDIPQTKKANPIPGKFTYNVDHDPCVTEYVTTIPLSMFSGSDLYIAAHAEIKKTLSHSISIASTIGTTVYGPNYSDPFADTNPLNDWATPSAAVKAKNHLSLPWNWGNNPATDISGAMWISTASDTENWTVDSWRYFVEEFNVPGHPTTSSVIVNADNEYWTYANGTQIGWDDAIFDPLLTHSFMPVMGNNTVSFVTENWGQGGPQMNNPNGITYLITVNYHTYVYESSWGSGSQFDGNNWAMYFPYTITTE